MDHPIPEPLTEAELAAVRERHDNIPQDPLFEDPAEDDA